ncbi:hypothetical protein AMJ47_03600 [Parcubacteria bacterium DG_72]|nr:MAG: hypothetical protein AMJ47_03600 [Parcubacteria bacterium DG_72]
MRIGIATVPLDYGKCPPWLFLRMKQLGRGIMLAIREEFGPDEILKRLADPTWFQSLGCVMGFDWNSSGLTTTTLGALKVGIFDIQDELGIYVCGGKKESRKTPEEIKVYSISRGFDFEKNLAYASKMAAKVDSSLIQDIANPFQLYQHNFIFSKSGNWAVIQQGMSIQTQKARRYHWLSNTLQQIQGLIEEPHSGIACDVKTNPLNLTAKQSSKNREISSQLSQEPKALIKDINLISEKYNKLIKQKRLPGFIQMELNNVEFHYHPVAREKFNLKRLEKTIFSVKEQNPKNFEQLLSLQGVGPKTIRALSLVSEIIYGAKPSYEDPARYTFAHGGKDGTPFPVDRDTYDKVLNVMQKGIAKSTVSLKEKQEAQKRLHNVKSS